MSKEVKRFTIGTFHAAIVSAGSECVLASDYDALLAERDALKKDAERYRWLREFIDQSPQVIEHLACSDGDLIDDVIDAALQGEQP